MFGYKLISKKYYNYLIQKILDQNNQIKNLKERIKNLYNERLKI